jgi:hypothetical protein
MKFKHKGGEVDVNKKLLASYSEEQLANFGDDNGIDAEDIVTLRSRIGEADVDTPQPTGKVVNAKKK